MTMANMRRAVILLVGALCVYCDIVYARDIEFTLKIRDERIEIGRQTYCEMIFPDNVPAPEAPFIKDLTITYVRSYTEESNAGAQNANMPVHSYRIVGRKAGSFTIGPVIFDYQGNIYRSNAVKLEVENILPSLQEETPVSEKTPADLSKHGYLVLEAPKTTVYINERAQIMLSYYNDSPYLGSILGGRIKSEDLIIEDVYSTENKVVVRDGNRYNLTRRLAMFTAQTAGRFMVKPVKVKVDIIDYKEGSVSGAPADKKEIYDILDSIRKSSQLIKDRAVQDQSVEPTGKGSVELTTGPLYITVLPLPKEGQPGDFTGAVGGFSFDLSASATEVKTGEDIILNMTIKGPGNYNTVAAPVIKKTAGIKQYGTHIARGQDFVTYEQVIRIQSADVHEIPGATFSFFSPTAEKYISITRDPIPIHVTAASGAAAAGKALEPEVKKEWVDSLKYSIYPVQKRATPFYRNKMFMLFETFPILIVMAGLAAFMAVRYLEMHPLYKASFAASRRAHRGLAKAQSMLGRKSPEEFYEFIFRILQGYLGTRCLKPTGGITSNIIEEIDTRGIEKDVIEKIREIFYDCYVAAYTEVILGEDDMRNTLNSLVQVVNDLDKKAEL